MWYEPEISTNNSILCYGSYEIIRWLHPLKYQLTICLEDQNVVDSVFNKHIYILLWIAGSIFID